MFPLFFYLKGKKACKIFFFILMKTINIGIFSKIFIWHIVISFSIIFFLANFVGILSYILQSQ